MEMISNISHKRAPHRGALLIEAMNLFKTMTAIFFTLVALSACNATQKSHLNRVIVLHDQILVAPQDPEDSKKTEYAAAETFFDYALMPIRWDEATSAKEAQFFRDYQKFKKNCQFEIYLTHKETSDSLGEYVFNADIRAKVLDQPRTDRSVLSMESVSRLRTPVDVRWEDRVVGSRFYPRFEEAQFRLQNVMNRLMRRHSSCFRSTPQAAP